MTVAHLPRWDNFAPSLVVAIKLVAKPAEFRHSKTGACVGEIDALTAGSELQRITQIDLSSTGRYRFNSNRARCSVAEDEPRIGIRQSAVQADPDSAEGTRDH